jgi:hypothetical protein
LPNPVVSKIHTGKKLTPEQIEKRSRTRLEKNGGIWQVAHGWKHTPETIERITIAVRKRDLTGANNPFFGMKHNSESRKKMGQRGEFHHNYHGGA